MKSRVARLVTLVSLLGAPLAAQAPFQDIFKFQGLYANDPTMFAATGPSSGVWVYASPYRGALAPLSTPSTFADIMIWCVDETHDAFIGQTYQAWITPLTSADFSHTRLGAGEKPEYDWAAFLAGSMNLNWSNAAAQAQTVALQDAMWAILGEGYNPANRVTAFEGTSYAASLGINGSTNFGVAPGGTFDPSQWALVTCDPGAGHSVSSCEGQEFLIQVGGVTTDTVTPEPATMTMLATGLIAMMGAGVRRKRKR